MWLVETLRRLGGLGPGSPRSSQRLRPESLYRRFVAYREALGFEVLAAGDGPVVYRALLQRLRGGGLVCLVADRDLSCAPASRCRSSASRRGCRPGPARLAALTARCCLPAFPSFTPDGWAVAIGATRPGARARSRDDVAKATQALADALPALDRDGPAPTGTCCSRCGPRTCGVGA